MKVAVIGLGKIGLPLALQLSKSNLGGVTVIGCDKNPYVVDCVNSGKAPYDNEPGLEERIRESHSLGTLRATLDIGVAVSDAKIVVIIVPLVVDSENAIRFENIDQVTQSVGKHMARDTLIVYETTLPVGTTRLRFAPILERSSGLSLGKDFSLAFSPERVSSGQVFADLARYPKILGGFDAKSIEIAKSLYESAITFEDRPTLTKPNGVWTLESLEAAEFSKLVETTFRDVNIALANQFAEFSERIGVKFQSVIESCNSQPYSHVHQPGISVGGHCIPIYPHMYLSGDPEATLVAEARKVNSSRPKYAVETLERELGVLNGQRVAVLGLAYRAGVKESAFSGTWDIVSEILKRGGVPLVHDPMYSRSEIQEHGFTPYTLGDSCHAVVLQTSHKEYSSLVPQDFPNARLFLDGRNSSPEAIRQGMPTYVIGSGYDEAISRSTI